MMTMQNKSILLDRRICLDAQYLDANYKDVLLAKMREETGCECTEKYGHITSVKRIVKIVDNYVSNVNCDVIFLVRFEVITLKPEVGDVMVGDVCMVFEGGIFLDIDNRQKVLISADSLGDDYVYKHHDKEFVMKDHAICIGDRLKFEILGSRYKTNTFSCFGRLVSE